MSEPDAPTFGARVEAVYHRTTGYPSPHGAQTWFAAQAGVSDRAVRYWFSGEREPSGPALKLLERMEADVGL